MDSTDTERLEEAKLELHRIMRSADNVGVPLIVIANKQVIFLNPGEFLKVLSVEFPRVPPSSVGSLEFPGVPFIVIANKLGKGVTFLKYKFFC